uniref:ATP synthase complex subunit 8 n=2 Tax=Gekkota TaxID=8560 RepID=A0A0C4ZPG7_9SAUR|nr:ATP synthase F0 subunit 8 [Hemidactylus bowringii]AIY32700.1 ATP synthase F0 subunit 8 [Teratoscincus roborowskii]AIY61202.1 ATP synthase F0 subunit 8 [Hemidactylus bowringii]AJJ48355.1 ATP synthase F0 subunit 8 [Teratoscincus roborowskii]
MPQLNPTPWFMTAVVTWAIIMLLLKPTMLQLHPMAPPNPSTQSVSLSHWTWTWH